MSAKRSRRMNLEALESRDVPSAFMPQGLPGGLAAVSEVHFTKIHAKGEGQIKTFDKATGQIATVGKIEGGVLHGTTEFSAQLIDAQGDYEGSTTVVTKHGLVFLVDTGVLSPKGTFTDNAIVKGGTKAFAGASGELVFEGHVLPDGVHFVDDSITGLLGLVKPTK